MYPTRFPRTQSSSWGVTSVRSAHAREGSTFKRRSSFIVVVDRCWRPSYATPEGLEPDAERALERHAETAELDQRRQATDGRRRAA